MTRWSPVKPIKYLIFVKWFYLTKYDKVIIGRAEEDTVEAKNRRQAIKKVTANLGNIRNEAGKQDLKYLKDS